MNISDYYGENTFSIKTMRNYLTEEAYNSLHETISKRKALDPAIADEIASAMKTWAIEKGASHYTHWFQPLTEATAEKHDSFICPDGEGGTSFEFSGKELIKGEPDASSFPSGGLRATFEARGYTGWDPTSPAFILETDNGSTLCIPSVFCGYHGEALDKKTPLLRSIDALADQMERLGKLFGIDMESRAYATLGSEQEYFLVDTQFFKQRLDLLETGRTLFGRSPAKHQQMDDHYFGAIKTRVMNFMQDLDRELWRLGIPAKTRHNEVCPAQFEIAPIFEEINLAVDHNMVTMDVMKRVAELHGFACLLHEKPFAGVNGSGKHNNWAVVGPDGKNWLSPGDNPRENAVFLTMIAALIAAVDTHADLLRASVATAGNDHRLGANEAPPAIISIFLGDELSKIILNLEHGGETVKDEDGDLIRTIEVGVSSLPPLPRDTTDRNRTSPFAFTGNKFEFRAVGSNQSCAGPNIVLNTIVAEALDAISTQLEKGVADGNDFNEVLQDILSNTVKKHKRILFNGDNYTQEWVQEAEKRGLPNLKNTDEALEALLDSGTVEVFEKYHVLTERELRSRYEVYREKYEETIRIEARCAAHMTRTQIAPSVLEYQGLLSEQIAVSESVSGAKLSQARNLLTQISKNSELMLERAAELEHKFDSKPLEVLDAMNSLRSAVDELEGLMPEDMWLLPSYSKMMFISNCE